MNRLYYIILSCLFSVQVFSSEWYLAKEATGANNGTSWTDAWQNPTNVVWSSIYGGDTLHISGGPLGGTNVYVGNLSTLFVTYRDGTLGSPITVKASREVGRNGHIKIIGGIVLSGNYTILDGSKADSTSDNVLDTWNILTNINLEVWQTNTVGGDWHAVMFSGTGTKIKWIEVSRMDDYDDSGIAFQSSVSRPVGNGTEIAYNLIHDVNGFGIRGEVNNFVTTNWGQVAIHHNLITNVHDNFMQVSACVDFYENICFGQPDPPAGHPDCVQEVQWYSRIYNNMFWNNQGSRFYVEANSTLTHSILGYNNLYFNQTNWYQTVGALPGTGFDITGHDGTSNTVCNLSNIWWFNNTMVAVGFSNTSVSLILWGNGTTSLPRETNSWITNVNFYNNNLVGMAPWNSGPVVSLSTNVDYDNNWNGWDYSTNEVRFDYNSLNGFTNTGNGIIYGQRGSHTAGQTPYTNMTQFAVETLYKSNNNAVAVMVDKWRYDFRPQVGDLALVGLGTNLTSLTNIAPNADKDIFGNPRGTSWDIGAFQHPEGFWVSITNGNDTTGNGSFGNPWKTLQKGVNMMTAGNVLNAAAGVYNEYVETVTNGLSGSQIIIRGYPANDPNNPVELRSFRFKHRFVTLEGFKLRKAVGLNGAMVRIESPGASYNGSDSIVTNNTICDGVMLFSRTADFGTNYVHIRDAYGPATNFIDAGFTSSAYVYFGSDSLHTYTNHGVTRQVLSNSTDGLTMYFQGTPLEVDPGTNYWIAMVTGSSGPDSWRGVFVVNKSGAYGGASNIVIAANTFSNLIGVAIDFGVSDGPTNRIVNNLITQIHGGYAMRLYGPNMEIGNNLLLDNVNICWFIGDELTNPDLHPGGGGFYDWQCNLTTAGVLNQTNIWFHHNWIQNYDNQMGEWNWATNSFDVRVENNVFVGIQAQMNAGTDQLKIRNNLFYRTAFQSQSPLGGLGAQPAYGQSNGMLGLVIASNVFVAGGSHANLSQEAPYGTNYLTNSPILMTNYAVTEETMGWTNTPSVEGTFGQGDPLFMNPRNPLGPDGLPFTEDDGLRVLPNSVIALLNLGPLTPLQLGYPIAHFRAIVNSWQDATGTNFNPNGYNQLAPPDRPGPVRPWNTYEAIGTSNATIVLTAEQSVDGTSLTNSGITAYRWLFNGTNAVTSTVPTITNTFTSSTNWVQLYVTNSAGSWGTYSNAYRVIYGTEGGGGEPEPPAGTNPPGTVIKANVNILSF